MIPNELRDFAFSALSSTSKGVLLCTVLKKRQMKMIKNFLLILVLNLTIPLYAISQNDNLSSIDYKIIAEGVDSPLENFQVVCFNKYFNLEQLSNEFTTKYGLTDKELFKKEMLVEIFHSDIENKGLDKIELIGIKEDEKEILIQYNVINSDKSNDNQTCSPFLIIQLPKAKKEIRFIVDGVELQKTEDIYILN